MFAEHGQISKMLSKKKKSDTKKASTIQFHLHEIQKQTKLTDGDGNQKRVAWEVGRRMD